MQYIDFHHHTEGKYGVYNMNFLQKSINSLYSIGLHPKDLHHVDDNAWHWFRENSLQEQCFAIGEAGLDAFVDISEGIQEKVFTEQILWANKIRKPVIIHCVRRFSQLLRFMKLAKVPMIIHGFNKKRTIADELLAKGFYLSFGKSVIYQVYLQEILKAVPSNRIFLETDTADFDIVELYYRVAEIKGLSVENLQEIITENFKNIQIK